MTETIRSKEKLNKDDYFLKTFPRYKYIPKFNTHSPPPQPNLHSIEKLLKSFPDLLFYPDNTTWADSVLNKQSGPSTLRDIYFSNLSLILFFLRITIINCRDHPSTLCYRIRHLPRRASPADNSFQISFRNTLGLPDSLTEKVEMKLIYHTRLYYSNPALEFFSKTNKPFCITSKTFYLVYRWRL